MPFVPCAMGRGFCLVGSYHLVNHYCEQNKYIPIVTDPSPCWTFGVYLFDVVGDQENESFSLSLVSMFFLFVCIFVNIASSTFLVRFIFAIYLPPFPFHQLGSNLPNFQILVCVQQRCSQRSLLYTCLHQKLR